MKIIEAVFLLLVCLGSLYGLFSLACVLQFFGRSDIPGSEQRDYPPVSILKPMKGIDSGWRENIASFAVQEYPRYELLLGFNDPEDEGIRLASDIARSYAPVMRVVVHTTNLGSNPKVSNLHGLVESARFPLLLISDSDAKVGRKYLKSVVGEYLATKNPGVVTSLSRITCASTVGAAMDSLTVAADFIPSVLTARCLEGVAFGLGPSMLFSKEALENAGGFQAFANYLAEDYQIGNRLWKKGYRNILSAYVVENVAGKVALRDYVVRQVRLSRTYRACRPKGFFGYGITHVLPFSLLFMGFHGVGRLSLSILAAVLALRFLIAFTVSQKCGYPKEWLKWLWLLPAKDLLNFGIWAYSFFGSNVLWRGIHYKLLRGGLMKKV